MFIRTNTNIYEVEDKRDGVYIVGEMAAIREDQVFCEAETVEELVDSFCLIDKNNNLIWTSEDVYAIESLSLKFEDSKIYAMIWTVTKTGIVSVKQVAHLEGGQYILTNQEGY